MKTSLPTLPLSGNSIISFRHNIHHVWLKITLSYGFIIISANIRYGEQCKNNVTILSLLLTKMKMNVDALYNHETFGSLANQLSHRCPLITLKAISAGNQVSKQWSHMHSSAALLRAIYSASIDGFATVDCCWLHQLMQLNPNKKHNQLWICEYLNHQH